MDDPVLTRQAGMRILALKCYSYRQSLEKKKIFFAGVGEDRKCLTFGHEDK
jgi:hypothetical protein